MLCEGAHGGLRVASNLGTGKSVIARGFIRACVGDPDLVVTSPTFLLDQTYQAPKFVCVRVPGRARKRLTAWLHVHCSVHHYDLYRLHQGDFEGLDLEHALEHGETCDEILYLVLVVSPRLWLLCPFSEVCLIEWAERLGEFAPRNRLDVFMQHTGNWGQGDEEESRVITFEPHGSRWQERVAAAMKGG